MVASGTNEKFERKYWASAWAHDILGTSVVASRGFMEKRQVVIGGPIPLFRAGLTHILAPLCDVATQTADVQDWIKLTLDEGFALAVVETDGENWALERLLKAFSSARRQTPVLAIVAALPFSDYSAKYGAVDGLTMLPSTISSEVLRGTARQQIEDLHAIENLTPTGFPATLTRRQLSILRHLCNAQSTKEIASLLNLSVRTVEFHKYRMMKILGVQSTTELLLHGVEAGLGGGLARSADSQRNTHLIEPPPAESATSPCGT